MNNAFSEMLSLQIKKFTIKIFKQRFYMNT